VTAAAPDSSNVAYAEGWNEPYSEALDEISEVEARRRHDAGEQYVALLGGHKQPSVAVELTLGKNLVQVYFLQPDGQATGIYTFTRNSAEEPLWLEQVYLQTWDGDRQKTFDWTVIHPDGRMHAERGGVGAPEKEVMDTTLSQKQLDEANMPEPVPSFGDYASISRFERS
jgi:hypothetical protein